MQAFNEQSLAFQEKIMERSGLGDDTYLPDGMLVFNDYTSLEIYPAANTCNPSRHRWDMHM